MKPVYKQKSKLVYNEVKLTYKNLYYHMLYFSAYPSCVSVGMFNTGLQAYPPHYSASAESCYLSCYVDGYCIYYSYILSNSTCYEIYNGTSLIAYPNAISAVWTCDPNFSSTTAATTPGITTISFAFKTI